MAYGHAERNLAVIRQLEAETAQLLDGLDELDPEQSAWLHEVTLSGGPGHAAWQNNLEAAGPASLRVHRHS
jgi:hypothetical protein